MGLFFSPAASSALLLLLLCCSLTQTAALVSSRGPLLRGAAQARSYRLPAVLLQLPDGDQGDGEEEEFEYAEEDPDAPVGIPLRDVDWDTAWVHFRTMRAARRPMGFETIVGLTIAAAVFGTIVHHYILSTGGIVLVPEEGVLSIYNFHELQNFEPNRLMKLGLPMPAVPQQLTLFQKLQMLGFSTHGG